MKILRTVSEVHEYFTQNSTQLVWGYMRVSTEGQEDGESFAVQSEAIGKYCAENDLGEPVIVQETASAAKRMFALPGIGTSPDTTAAEVCPRPLLLALVGYLSGLAPEHSKHLVVWKLDRVSRLSEESEIMYQLLVRGSVDLHSCWAGEDSMLQGGGGDPTKILMRQIFGAFGQYERAVIEARLMAGRRAKGARGGFTGGSVPFGYDTVNKDLVINQPNAEIVRHIFYLRALGSSYRDIAKAISHDARFMIEKFNHVRVMRVLRFKQLYEGWYKDCYKDTHARPDLKILKDAS